MQVHVLYFGVLRDKYIHEREGKMEVNASATVGDLIAEICVRHPGFEEIQTAVRIAVNEEFAKADRALADGDVVALLPPVAGG